MVCNVFFGSYLYSPNIEIVQVLSKNLNDALEKARGISGRDDGLKTDIIQISDWYDQNDK